MNSYIQLLCLILSFIFGILIYYANIFNNNVLKRKNIIIKLMLSVLYLFNMSLLYVVLLYKLNDGVLHIYFVLLILLGYLFCCVRKRK